VARAETGSGPERTATRELDAPSEPRNPPAPTYAMIPIGDDDVNAAHEATVSIG